MKFFPQKQKQKKGREIEQGIILKEKERKLDKEVNERGKDRERGRRSGWDGFGRDVITCDFRSGRTLPWLPSQVQIQPRGSSFFPRTRDHMHELPGYGDGLHAWCARGEYHTNGIHTIMHHYTQLVSNLPTAWLKVSIQGDSPYPEKLFCCLQELFLSRNVLEVEWEETQLSILENWKWRRKDKTVVNSKLQSDFWEQQKKKKKKKKKH